MISLLLITLSFVLMLPMISSQCQSPSALLPSITDNTLFSASSVDTTSSSYTAPCSSVSRSCSYGWKSATNDDNQWIQISFPKTMNITAFSIYKLKYAPYFMVNSFYLQSSLDGIVFSNYQVDQVDYLFSCPYPGPCTFNLQPNSTLSRFIRLTPRSWYNSIGLQWEIYGCVSAILYLSNSNSIAQIFPITLPDNFIKQTNLEYIWYIPVFVNATIQIQLTDSNAVAIMSLDSGIPFIIHHMNLTKLTINDESNHIVTIMGQSESGMLDTSTVYVINITRPFVCIDKLISDASKYPDGWFSASSASSSDYAPAYSRMTSSYGWRTDYGCSGQYLQITYDSRKIITAIQVAAGRSPSYYISSFYLQYSQDGNNFVNYQENSTSRAFACPYPGPCFLSIPNTIISRFIRLLSISCYSSYAGIKWELYGCNGQLPSLLANKSDIISISAAAYQPTVFLIIDKRYVWDIPSYTNSLLQIQTLDPNAGALVKVDDRQPIQVQNMVPFTITLAGDTNTHVITVIGQAESGLLSTSSMYSIYVTRNCSNPLISDISRYPNSWFSASSTSSTSGSYAPYCSRLSSSPGCTAWVADVNDQKQYIQMSYDSPKVFTSLTIDTGSAYKVTSFYIQYSNDNVKYITYAANGNSGLFTCSVPCTVGLYNVTSQFIRLVPQSWSGGIGLRWELYGCDGLVTGPTYPVPVIIPTTRAPTTKPPTVTIPPTSKPPLTMPPIIPCPILRDIQTSKIITKSAISPTPTTYTTSCIRNIDVAYSSIAYSCSIQQLVLSEALICNITKSQQVQTLFCTSAGLWIPYILSCVNDTATSSSVFITSSNGEECLGASVTFDVSDMNSVIRKANSNLPISDNTISDYFSGLFALSLNVPKSRFIISTKTSVINRQVIDNVKVSISPSENCGIPTASDLANVAISQLSNNQSVLYQSGLGSHIASGSWSFSLTKFITSFGISIHAIQGVVGGIVLVFFIIIVAVHKKKYPTSDVIVFGTLLLSIISLFSVVAFASTVIQYGRTISDDTLIQSGWASVTGICLAAIVNIGITTSIVYTEVKNSRVVYKRQSIEQGGDKQKQQVLFEQWVGENITVMSVMVLLSAFDVCNLLMLSSRLFYLNALSAPFSARSKLHITLSSIVGLVAVNVIHVIVSAIVLNIVGSNSMSWLLLAVSIFVIVFKLIRLVLLRVFGHVQLEQLTAVKIEMTDIVKQGEQIVPTNEIDDSSRGSITKQTFKSNPCLTTVN